RKGFKSISYSQGVLMGQLGTELFERSDDIVQAWYEAWLKSTHPHSELSEAILKNSLAKQLRTIGEQIPCDSGKAEPLENLWKVSDRLDPEARVQQNFLIEEVIHEYRLVVETVRNWIEEREIDVAFEEYSYFYQAIFFLTAESIRRYQRY